MKRLLVALFLLALPALGADLYPVYTDNSGGFYTRGAAVTNPLSVGGSGDFSSNRYVSVADCSREPMGLCYDIAERASMVFTNSTRTFAIYSSTNWTYWHAGTPVVRTNDSIAISTNLGLHFIYYDDTTATIKESTVPWNFSNDVQVAMVYWDGVEGTLSWEAHKMTMDWATHDELHSTFGARWASGLRSTAGINAITNEAGVFYDEDIRFSISATTNTALAFHTNGVLCLRAGHNKPYLTNSTGVIVYDNGTTTNTVAAGEYVASFTFAANVPASPIVTVIGQRVDTTLANAKANNTLGNLLTGSLPLAEMKPLARHIYHRANGTGTLIYDEAEDLRNLSIITSTTAPLPPHDSTIGAASSTIHTNYAPLTGATFTGTMIATNAGIVSNALAVGGTAAALILTNNDARSQTLSNTSVSNASGVVASRNLQLGSYWLSGDGENEGVFVDTSGGVLIGTNTAMNSSDRLTVTAPSSTGGNLVQFSVYSATNATALNMSSLRFLSSAGTLNAPLASQNDQGLGGFVFGGFDGTSWVGNMARLSGRAVGTLSASSKGASVRIDTCATNSTTLTTRLIVQANGCVNFVPMAAFPVGPATGDTMMHSVSNKMFTWDGSVWRAHW